MKQNYRRPRICDGKDSIERRGRGRYVYGEIRRQGIRAGNIIIRRVSRSSKAARKKEIKGNDGTAREKGGRSGEGVRRSRVYSSVRLESEMFGGRVIFLRRSSTAGIPRYRCVSVISLCVRVRICVQERIS